MSQPVDAVVMEYHLGLLDGAVVASEIKQAKPQIPIVMVCDNLELPDDAWKSVDAIAIKSDGQHFLAATIHFVLSVEWEQQQATRTAAAGKPFNRLGLGRPRRTTTTRRRSPPESADAQPPPGSLSTVWEGPTEQRQRAVAPHVKVVTQFCPQGFEDAFLTR
jgi:DNA-binding NarL/FixJ family response regulator